MHRLKVTPNLLIADYGRMSIATARGHLIPEVTSPVDIEFPQFSFRVFFSPRRRRHFAAAASHILSSRSQPFSRRAAAASHICVTAATPYFLANYNFHERKR
jgi:hypothetical protein